MDKEYISQLYESGDITNNGVLNAVSMGWIDAAEAVSILGESNLIGVIRSAKLAEISKACNTTIVNGIDVEIEDRVDHFNLSLEDQSNINNLFRVVELGGTQFPYQADDGTCMVYSASDIVKIYIATQTHITTQTAYHNALKAYVLSMDDAETIGAVSYGMELPEEYAVALQSKLTVASEQMASIVSRLTGSES